MNHIQSYNARSSLSSQRNAFVFEIENLKCLKAFLHAKNGNSLKPGYFSLTYHYAIFRNLNSNYHFLFNALMIMLTWSSRPTLIKATCKRECMHINYVVFMCIMQVAKALKLKKFMCSPGFFLSTFGMWELIKSVHCLGSLFVLQTRAKSAVSVKVWNQCQNSSPNMTSRCRNERAPKANFGA